MKNLLITIAIALMSSLAMASETRPISTSLDLNKNEKTVVLNFSELKGQIKLVTISNSLGENILSEEVNKYEHGVKYNLSTLPEGAYDIKVEGENFIEIHKTVITFDGVEFETVELHARPTVKVVNDILSVQAGAFNEENMNVSIYNNAGELIYKVNYQTCGDLTKTFNLGRLAKDEYNVIVSNDYYSLSNTIAL